MKVGSLNFSSAIRETVNWCFSHTILGHFSYKGKTKRKFIRDIFGALILLLNLRLNSKCIINLDTYLCRDTIIEPTVALKNHSATNVKIRYLFKITKNTVPWTIELLISEHICCTENATPGCITSVLPRMFFFRFMVFQAVQYYIAFTVPIY